MAGRLREGLSPRHAGPPSSGRSLAGAGRTGGRDGRRDLLFRWRPDGTYRRRRGRSHATPGGAADGPYLADGFAFRGCWGESGHHFRPAGPVWAVCDALPRRRGGQEERCGPSSSPCGRRGGNRPAPPPGAAAGGPVSDAGGAGRPGGPRDRVVWREADMRSAPPTPSIWGSGCPTGGQCWPPGARRRHERRTGTDPGGADRPPQWEGYPGSTCLERDGADVPLRAGGRSIPAGVPLGPGRLSRLSGGRYDPEAGRWEELYGRRVKLTFGLDLYGERAQGTRHSRRPSIPWRGAPSGRSPGMRLLELSCGRRSMTREGSC